ncbi:O-antigen ligase family protein [Bradyrhizobium sp. IC3195]|uniref:O-antigen ligase family protein n=1 Tax=Bradyrhizobium sp. IC3195 TaxID=2793804 RepID=UPI001CD603EE|nr:O-antigen ligase family protein [Bradyrhizobium sp. IC3195]MCA1467130.1 O-antigen ligase family protein [Bradyrhizobium sp. IC3195]
MTALRARSIPGFAPSSEVGRSRRIPAWLALIGALLPFELAIYIADARFTPARLLIVLLLPAALTVLLRKERRPVISDLLIFVTAAWMIYAGYSASTLSPAGAEALELFGSYVVGRAYFLGRPALENFVGALKVVTITLVGLGFADTLSGRFLVHDIVTNALHLQSINPQYREGWIRATATLDHPILFGVFCALAATIFLYSERSAAQRLLFVGLCSLGCIASLSSAAYLSLILVITIYAYDCLLKRYYWRWQLLGAMCSVFIALVFLLSNNPVGWLVSHMTLDPESGYYRIMIWDIATAQIALSPIFGFGVIEFNDQVLDNTVDSIWLVMSLRFGIPAIALLCLTTLATFVLTGRHPCADDDYEDQIRTGFTLVLVTYLVVGLTVHFWNYTWIFWGLCAGIRASLYERQSARRGQQVAEPVSPVAKSRWHRRNVASSGLSPRASKS